MSASLRLIKAIEDNIDENGQINYQYINDELEDLKQEIKFVKETMNTEILSDCCNYPTYSESGDCGYCGEFEDEHNLRVKQSINKIKWG